MNGKFEFCVRDTERRTTINGREQNDEVLPSA